MNSADHSPSLAKQITIAKRGGSYRFTIDGEPFPYMVADGTVSVDVTDSCPGVLLKILAEDVEVVHSLDGE